MGASNGGGCGRGLSWDDCGSDGEDTVVMVVVVFEIQVGLITR